MVLYVVLTAFRYKLEKGAKHCSDFSCSIECHLLNVIQPVTGIRGGGDKEEKDRVVFLGNRNVFTHSQ